MLFVTDARSCGSSAEYRIDGGVENELPSPDQHEIVQRQSLRPDVIEELGEQVRIETLALRRHNRPRRRRRALLASGKRQAHTECQSQDDGNARSGRSARGQAGSHGDQQLHGWRVASAMFGAVSARRDIPVTLARHSAITHRPGSILPASGGTHERIPIGIRQQPVVAVRILLKASRSGWATHLPRGSWVSLRSGQRSGWTGLRFGGTLCQ